MTLKMILRQPAIGKAITGVNNPAKARSKPKATVKSASGTMGILASKAIGVIVPKCHNCRGAVPIHAAPDNANGAANHSGNRDKDFFNGSYMMTMAPTAANDN